MCCGSNACPQGPSVLLLSPLLDVYLVFLAQPECIMKCLEHILPMKHMCVLWGDGAHPHMSGNRE